MRLVLMACMLAEGGPDFESMPSGGRARSWRSHTEASRGASLRLHNQLMPFEAISMTSLMHSLQSKQRVTNSQKTVACLLHPRCSMSLLSCSKVNTCACMG